MACFVILILLITMGIEASSDDILTPGIHSTEQMPLQQPVDVRIAFAIRSFGPVDHQKMTVATELYLRQYWKDSRMHKLYNSVLRERNYSAIGDVHNHSTVFLAETHHNTLWKPDVFFPDAIRLTRPIIQVEDSMQLQVGKHGSFFYSMRVIVETRCRMHLNFFPVDVQECPVCISHYKYPAEEQSIRWYEVPIEMSRVLKTPHFEVHPDVRISSFEEFIMNRTYITLCAHLKFSRKLNQYIFVMYFPSFALTGLSFLNFWIDKKAVPARAGLSITSILTQITLMTGVSLTFPSGSDLKMMDIYLIVNFIFTVFTLIEFTLVSYEGSEKRQRKQSVRKLGNGNTSSRHVRKIECCKLLTCKPKSKDIDVISRYLVVTLFLLWNAVYFAIAFLALHWEGFNMLNNY